MIMSQLKSTRTVFMNGLAWPTQQLQRGKPQGSNSISKSYHNRSNQWKSQSGKHNHHTFPLYLQKGIVLSGNCGDSLWISHFSKIQSGHFQIDIVNQVRFTALSKTSQTFLQIELKYDDIEFEDEPELKADIESKSSCEKTLEMLDEVQFTSFRLKGLNSEFAGETGVDLSWRNFCIKEGFVLKIIHLLRMRCFIITSVSTKQADFVH